MTRPFIGTELTVISRFGKPHPAPPPMLDSLRRAGWLEQVSIESSLGEASPFRLGKMPTAWRITDAGRIAVAACPEFYPGDPVDATDPDGPMELDRATAPDQKLDGLPALRGSAT